MRYKLPAIFKVRWTNDWELPLAAEESHCLVIRSRQRNYPPSYTLHCMGLKHAIDVRDFGFLMTSELIVRFDLHYKSVAKKANFWISNLFKIGKTIILILFFVHTSVM